MNKIIASLFLFLTLIANSEDLKYPFIYIPGMFDNGDLLTSDSLLVKNINNTDGFYFKEYFNGSYIYDGESIVCSSNIVGSKYQRLSVANVIGEYRTNISIKLMADRLYCLINGTAPDHKNYKVLTNVKGNDWSGTVERNGVVIRFTGLMEEIWAKYGKKVYYENHKGIYRIIAGNNGTGSTDDAGLSFENSLGYFDKFEDIKFNIVAHSSGGLAIREVIRYYLKEGKAVPVNSIINLSVPQKGARLVPGLMDNFPKLIRTGIASFYSNVEQGTIDINDENGSKVYKYSDLEKLTRIDLLKNDGFFSDFIVDILSAYILYFIPFDGRKRVLGNDPALYDLNPNHGFVKRLNKTPIPEYIRIYNYKVRSPYAKMFAMLALSSGLGESDGVVDYLDTSLENIPGYDLLTIKDIDVGKANHIPMPYIKPLFELGDTIDKNYSVLKLLLKKNQGKEENIKVITALFYSIFKEMDFDPVDFMKNKNFSVIDYFAENPVGLQ